MADGYDVVIAGAGVGGLTAASLLAKAGMKVLILERLERVGGCCSNYDHNGFRPEVGAVFVIGREFYYKLFELLELRLEDYLDFMLIDPVYHVYLHDGREFPLPRSVDEAAEVVGRISPRDKDNFHRYCSDMDKIFRAYLAFLADPMPELSEVPRLSRLAKRVMKKEVLAAVPVNARLALRNLDKVVRSYFSDEYVQLLFGWENMYAGLPAHRCTGLFALISYLGRVGYYYPRGGMISIPLALKKIAESFGAEVRTGSEVKRITTAGGEVKGVELVDGEVITSRRVVSNVHSRITYLKLVGEEMLPGWAARTIRNQPCSIPAPVFHLGLKEKRDDIKAHMSLYATPRKQFDGIWEDFYDRGLLYRPGDGAYMIITPTYDDPSLAPPGKQVMSVIYIAPYELRYHRWDDIAEEWAWEVVSFLDRKIFPGLEGQVEWLDSVSPMELERRLNVAEGAFFGLEMSLSNMGPFRPGYRSRLVKGLYLVGQCTNPGLGVPGAMISGIATSALMLNDGLK
jgi:phytoene desaturase